MKPNKVFFNWSSGKDAALAYYLLIQSNQYQVAKLFTTVHHELNRVSMHGLRVELLKQQIKSIGLSYQLLKLPENCDMPTYNKLMADAINELKHEGFTHAAFGDIFLEDLRVYRDEKLKKVGLKGVYPLWQRDTKELVYEMLDLGFKMVVVCAHSKYFNEDFVGKVLTKELIKTLPEEVDPCGENGEFHTFCFDGPIFKRPIRYETGEKVLKYHPNPSNEEQIGFWYIDLLPK